MLVQKETTLAQQWLSTSQLIINTQRNADSEIRGLKNLLLSKQRPIEFGGQYEFSVVSLTPEIYNILNRIHYLSGILSVDTNQLDELAAELHNLAYTIEKGAGFLTFGEPHRKSKAAKLRVRQLASAGVGAYLDSILANRDQSHSTEAFTTKIADQVFPGQVELVSSGFQHIPIEIAQLNGIISKTYETYTNELKEAGNRALDTQNIPNLNQFPVDDLKPFGERLPLNKIKQAGIINIGQLTYSRLQSIPGVGGVGISNAITAIRHFEEAKRDENRNAAIRFDLSKRTPEQTELLRQLNNFLAKRRIDADSGWRKLIWDFQKLNDQVDFNGSFLLIGDGVNQVNLRGRLLDRFFPLSNLLDKDIWAEFQQHSADFYSILDEMGFGGSTHIYGDLPQDVIDKVLATDLDTRRLTIPALRRYQTFAARFAAVQKRVILGDEMGLGKTIEALALVAHLNHKTLVVCPAAVVVNWLNEISDKTKMTGYRIHGSEQESGLRAWQNASGGAIGVTTYETLKWLLGRLADPSIPVVVADEAHYAKNPEAARTQNVRQLLARSEYALLLSGTPMENKVREFQTLLSHIQPHSAKTAPITSVRQFRSHIAPYYLRRNAVDVLKELPDLIEEDQWIEVAGIDENLHVTKQKQLTFRDKLPRLREIIEEETDEGNKVVVFCHFLNNVAACMEEFGSKAVGPITGAISPEQRQMFVDDFTKRNDGSVLVAQIRAGGTGLNIQAASVVIIVDPQYNPQIERQAIARAHRMGQEKPVHVYRLLAAHENT
ncbi:MAG: DEAD/DEAH box helicase, partial [Cellulomonadaceae bacterium]|nr:DEAD/DEAH box helicase [Cellulomonadaceae bacterium]